jgi:hypothetical protein
VRPGELEDPEVSSLLVKPRAERMVPWRACCGLAVGHWTSAAFSLWAPLNTLAAILAYLSSLPAR